MVAVPLLKARVKSQKAAQASSIAVILPLCIISAAVYFYRGYYEIGEALRYIPFSFFGGIFGAFILKKIPDKMLKKIFALFMLYSGIRMIMK